MKTIAINLAAGWTATLTTWQDGDVFRETNTDDVSQDLADRLGWLKNAVDGKAAVGSDNAWTGDNIFNTDAGVFQVTGAGDAEFQTPAIFSSNVEVNGTSQFNDDLYVAGGLVLALHDLPNANAAIPSTAVHCRVPAASAANTYTLPATAGLTNGHTVFVERVDTGGGLITIQDPTGPTTVGTITASQIGWISFIKRGSNWRVALWGGTVDSIHSTP